MSKVKSSIMLYAAAEMSYVFPYFAGNSPYEKKKSRQKKNNLTSDRVIWTGGGYRKVKHGPQGKRAKKEFRKATHLQGYYSLVKRGLIDAHRRTINATAN